MAFAIAIIVGLVWISSPRFRFWYRRQNTCLMWFLFGIFPLSLWLTAGFGLWVVYVALSDPVGDASFTALVVLLGLSPLPILYKVTMVNRRDSEHQRIRNAVAIEAIKQSQ